MGETLKETSHELALSQRTEETIHPRRAQDPGEGERDSGQGGAGENGVQNRRRQMMAPPRDGRRFLKISYLRKENEMKTAITIVMTLALAAISGCQSSSLRGGGMTEDVGFKIIVPTGDTDVKQGEVRNVTISLQRGENFKQGVKLEIKASEGISVYPTDVQVKASEIPDIQLRIATTRDTALGAYLVSVKGTPKTGEPTSIAFTVKVVAP